MAVTITSINRGSTPGDGTGDTAYDGAGIINTNFTNLKAAADLVLDVPQDYLLGRITASTGDVEQLTAAQVRSILNVEDGATADGAFSADVNTQITPSTAILLDQDTGDEKALDLSFEVDKLTSGSYYGIYMNVTQTSTPGPYKRLIDLYADSTRIFTLSSDGSLFVGGPVAPSSLIINDETTGIRSGSNSSYIFYGSSIADYGARMLLYGNNHATQASDIDFEASAGAETTILVLRYDHSATKWDFQDRDIATSGDISGGTFTGVEGTAIQSTGESGGTKFLREDGDGTCSWQTVAGGSGAFTADATTAITPTTAITLDEDTGDEYALDLSLTVNKLTSGNYVGIYMDVTETSAPGSADYFAYWAVGGTEKFSVNNAGTVYGGFGKFSALQLRQSNSIWRDIATSYLEIGGGSASSNGGHIRLYGGSHSTQAADIEFYGDATLQLQYDDSLSRWDFQANGIWAGGTIRCGGVQVTGPMSVFRNNDASYLGLGGGSSANSGANILLYGGSEGTTPYDMQFRSDTTVELLFDYSADNWDFKDNKISNSRSGTSAVLMSLSSNLGTSGVRSFNIQAPSSDSVTEPFIFNTANSWQFNVDAVAYFQIDSSGYILVPNIPTSDPTVAGALWSNSGVLTVSSG